MSNKSEYPLKRYLDAGVHVSVNTDNIGISAATLTDNILLAARMNPGLTRLEILQLLAHALTTASVSHRMRAELHRKYETQLPSP